MASCHDARSIRAITIAEKTSRTASKNGASSAFLRKKQIHGRRNKEWQIAAGMVFFGILMAVVLLQPVHALDVGGLPFAEQGGKRSESTLE